MPELKFDLMFNTPAFLGSTPCGTKTVVSLRRDRESQQWIESRNEVAFFPVDERGIRIPSLRGVLELWHRTLLGDRTSATVFAEQGKVFGSVDHGQGVSFRPLGRPRFEHRDLVYQGDERYALVYMGYGPLQLLRLSAEEEVATSYNRSQCRNAVLVEPRARFRFAVRGTEEQLRAVERSLILLHLFGGLGGRSRRGWGSVEVETGCIDKLPKSGDLVAWFRSQLEKVWTPPETSDSAKPSFSAFSAHTRICLTEPISGRPEEVILDFFRRFQYVRNYRRSALARADHDVEMNDAGLASGTISTVPARIAFGMPYTPASGRRWKIEYRGCLPGRANPEEAVTRRASPLFLKVLRLGPKLHMGVALFLDAEFFGDPRLQIGANTGPELDQKLDPMPFPGYGAVEALLNGNWAASFAKGIWTT